MNENVRKFVVAKRGDGLDPLSMRRDWKQTLESIRSQSISHQQTVRHLQSQKVCSSTYKKMLLADEERKRSIVDNVFSSSNSEVNTSEPIVLLRMLTAVAGRSDKDSDQPLAKSDTVGAEILKVVGAKKPRISLNIRRKSGMGFGGGRLLDQ
ncbi:hypothetical protein HK096_006496 [Nowakowskiella sp. JEL0078]|nr:hypothetical protein HK096_006496 [Nowakowskiella sp. JEL0078]